METVTKDLFGLDTDILIVELKEIFPNWNDMDFNMKMSYRNLYFIYKLEMSTFGQSLLSKHFEKDR